MKTASVATAAVLAGVAIAQPHGHHGHQHRHAKRELVVEWETVWETVTVIVDESTTQTFFPTHTTSGIPGEFFQTPASSSTSTPEPQPEPTVAETTSVQPLPTTTTAAATSSSSSSSSSPPPPPPPPTTTPLPEPEPEPTPEPEPVPEPEPTTSVAPPPPPVETPTPEPQGSGSSYAGSDAFGTSSMDSAKYAGDITYYALGLGACGYDDSGADQTKHIVALSHVDWYNRGSGTSLGINMPNHAWCDQTITISAGGKTTTALVHDICPGCAPGSIDVSEAVFDALFGGLGAGREQATWSFN